MTNKQDMPERIWANKIKPYEACCQIGSLNQWDDADNKDGSKPYISLDKHREVVEDYRQDLLSALSSDLENGVKWLNEKAIQKFKTEYPALYLMLTTKPDSPIK